MLAPVIFTPFLLAAQPLDKAVVRTELEAVYKKWDVARVAVDKAELEKALLPDFYVVLQDRKLTREQFLAEITGQPSNVRHLRFSSRILTVNKQGDDWMVIDSEKIEVEITPESRPRFHGYSYWITRDVWHKTPDHGWQARSSEWIGNESWKDTVPFDDWSK